MLVYRILNGSNAYLAFTSDHALLLQTVSGYRHYGTSYRTASAVASDTQRLRLRVILALRNGRSTLCNAPLPDALWLSSSRLHSTSRMWKYDLPFSTELQKVHQCHVVRAVPGTWRDGLPLCVGKVFAPQCTCSVTDQLLEALAVYGCSYLLQWARLMF